MKTGRDRPSQLCQRGEPATCTLTWHRGQIAGPATILQTRHPSSSCPRHPFPSLASRSSRAVLGRGSETAGLVCQGSCWAQYRRAELGGSLWYAAQRGCRGAVARTQPAMWGVCWKTREYKDVGRAYGGGGAYRNVSYSEHALPVSSRGEDCFPKLSNSRGVDGVAQVMQDDPEAGLCGQPAGQARAAWPPRANNSASLVSSRCC